MHLGQLVRIPPVAATMTATDLNSKWTVVCSDGGVDELKSVSNAGEDLASFDSLRQTLRSTQSQNQSTPIIHWQNLYRRYVSHRTCPKRAARWQYQ